MYVNHSLTAHFFSFPMSLRTCMLQLISKMLYNDIEFDIDDSATSYNI